MRGLQQTPLSRLKTFNSRRARPNHVSWISTTARRKFNVFCHQRVLFAAALGLGTSAYFFLPDPSRSARTSSKEILSPNHFTPVTVVSNDSSGPNTKLLKLAVPLHLIPPPSTPIWSVYIKDDDIQVERPYTPLESIDSDGHMLFWIKKYESGEVGRWLHSKRPGDKIELRGPLKTWTWEDDTWDEVVMISGGTGITPFCQLFHSLKPGHGSRSSPKFTLIHSSRTLEELPPPSILRPLVEFASENPANFKLHIFVDHQDRPSISSSISNLQFGRIDQQALQKCLGLEGSERSWWSTFFRKETPRIDSRRILFLVCGPEPLISSIAGPYGRNFSQGAVGGMLGGMGYSSHQVWKL